MEGTQTTESNPAGEGVPAEGLLSTGKSVEVVAPKTAEQVAVPEYPEWRKVLPEDIRASESLNKFNDVNSIIKSYINLEKHMGSEKINVPSKHATPEDWKAVYKKLGLPEKMDDYVVKAPEGVDVANDPVFSKFREAAFANGVLPHQAQAILDTYNKASAELIESNKKAQAMQLEQEIGQLKQQWGMAFEANLSRARNAVAALATPEQVQYLEKSGLNNNVELVKMFAKVGELLGEDKIKGVGVQTNLKSPDQARREYLSIMSNADHPYHISHHAGHKQAVEEVRELFNMMNPS